MTTNIKTVQGLSPNVARPLSLKAKAMKIEVQPIEQRTWKTLEELPYTPEEIVQIVHRYCDSQDHAKAYRVKKAEEFKAMKARLAEIDGDGGEED